MHASVFVFLSGMLIALPEMRLFFERSTTLQIACLLFFAFVFRHFVHLDSLPALIAQVLLLAAVVGSIRWASVRTKIHVFLESSLSQFFGKISYSFYLLNVPVLWVIWYLPSFQAYLAGMGQLWGGILSGFVAVILTIPIAALSHRLLELRFITFGALITNYFNKRERF